MQKWEYMEVYVGGKHLTALARLGEQGWELVTSSGPSNTTLILKRPKL